MVNIARLCRNNARDVAFFHSALLVTVLITNAAETSFLRATHLLWIIMCISIIEVNAHLRSIQVSDSQLARTRNPAYT
jgi:hypothetical protein